MNLLELLGGKKLVTVAAIDQATAKATEELESARNRLAGLQVDRPRLLLELSAADLRGHDDKISDASREVERITAALAELDRRKVEAQHAEAHAALTERIKATSGWPKRRRELLMGVQRSNLAAARSLHLLKVDDEKTLAVHRDADLAGRFQEIEKESNVDLPRTTRPYLENFSQPLTQIPSVFGPDPLWPVNLLLWTNPEERFAAAEAELAGKPFQRSMETPERPAPVPAKPEHVTTPRLNARREGDAVHLDVVAPLDGRIVVQFSPTREFGAKSVIVHSVIGCGVGPILYPFVDLRKEAGFYQAFAQAWSHSQPVEDTRQFRSEVVEVEAYTEPEAVEVSA